MRIVPNARIAILLTITVAGILPISVYLAVPATHAMTRFHSDSELEQFLLLRSRCNMFQAQGGRLVPATGAVYSQLASQNGESSDSVNVAPSHSETNNQVKGVDELDTLKNDGHFIYTVANNTVLIVDAYPVTSAQVVSRISVEDKTIAGIFVDGNRLAIVAQQPRTYYGTTVCGPALLSAGSTVAVRCYECYTSLGSPNTTILVYDLTNRSSPTLQTSATVNGTFIGARLIANMAYVVSTTPAFYNQSLPVITVNRVPKRVQSTDVYHSDVSDRALSYTVIMGIPLAQTAPQPAVETFLLGTSSTIYVSSTNIFLTQPTWESSEETIIHRISISGSSIVYESTGSVPGHILNQFSMDESNSFFRVTTSNYGWEGMGTNVYVLDESLKMVGKLEGLSQGEQFYAARFIGDKAYLVTFKRLDPLFVVDLKDPTKPSLLGQLNVTGVSDYLQPYDDSHLIGIGKSAQTIDWENAALFLGVKLSLFDVSNPTHPADLSDYTVGDRGTDSPALSDQKAVLFDRSLNLLVIPILVVHQTTFSQQYQEYATQGAFVFQVTLGGGIVLRGIITHIPAGIQPQSIDSPYFVTRALFIGSVLYTVSGMLIKMNSLGDLSELGSISLA